MKPYYSDDLVTLYHGNCLVIAEWLTAPDNPYFSTNVANRVWAHFFGRGIVEPVDDWERAKPTHPELLDWLARDFVDSRRTFGEFFMYLTIAIVVLSTVAGLGLWQLSALPSVIFCAGLFAAPTVVEEYHRRLRERVAHER